MPYSNSSGPQPDPKESLIMERAQTEENVRDIYIHATLEKEKKATVAVTAWGVFCFHLLHTLALKYG